MRARVGLSCKEGQLLAISRKGNIRPYRTDVKGVGAVPIGFAGELLRRGKIAFTNTGSFWFEVKESVKGFDPAEPNRDRTAKVTLEDGKIVRIE